MQISKTESKVLEMLRRSEMTVFTIKDIRFLLGFDTTKVYNIVKALKGKGLLAKVGKHIFLKKEANELEVASQLHYPSYVSFWTALNYYGYSDQNPRFIFIATTKYKKSISNFKYITFAKEKFFGYTNIGNITIAEREKSILDSLLFPKYSGGMKEIERSLKRVREEARQKRRETKEMQFSIKKLISYALAIKSKAVIRRLGFLLEAQGYQNNTLIEKLQQHKGKGYELFDPSLLPKGKLNKRWLLNINT